MNKAAAQLLGSDLFSDMTIGCGGRIWKCHKTVVCMQSKFFKRAFTSGMEEQQTGHIELGDKDPVVIDAMVMWLYTGQYSRQSEDSDASGVMTLEILKGLAGDRAMRKCCTDLAVPVAESTAYQDGPLAFHAKVYAVAKEYCILGLQTASSRNFSRFLNKRSPDDLCAAALVIHSSVPSDDTELRVQCVNKTARTFEELVQAENYTLVLSLAPDFVNDIAVEMRRQVKTLSEQNGRQELLLIVRCEACSKFDLP